MKMETITPVKLNDLSGAQKCLGDAIKFPVNDLLTLSDVRDSCLDDAGWLTDWTDTICSHHILSSIEFMSECLSTPVIRKLDCYKG